MGENLFISEVFNGGPRGLQYVEVYNPNPEPIDFSTEEWVIQTLVNPSAQASPEFREILLAGHVLGYVTFWLNFHHFDRIELDLCGHTHVQGAAFSCLRLKWADLVLI